MKPLFAKFAATFFFAIIFSANTFADTNSLVLWYRQPAKIWNEALPIGNGRMGAMIFGDVPEERIQFNEDTLWKGHPHDYVRAGAQTNLSQIQQFLFEGKVKDRSEERRVG